MEETKKSEDLGIRESSNDSTFGPDRHSNSGAGVVKKDDTAGGGDNPNQVGSNLGTDGSASNAGDNGYGSSR